MPNYNEVQVQGVEYTRCHHISIVNPLNKTPAVTFQEQKVLVLGDNVFENNTGSICIAFDPNKSIPLIDPETGTLTGNSVTFADVYQILYSAYVQEAQARDSQQNEQPV